MSWTQGVQLRADLPSHFVKWADSQSELGKLECIVWDDTEPNVVHLDFYNEGKIVEAKTFKLQLPT